ncbi:MAG TPA: NADPH-dependent 7-cyano-7-deazaguanine reductase QueF [Planctomycetaceae bacterium]|nr:preQ(1) synthase [Planctomycetales bacterium]HAA62244.1 NADPH-dependent 7-cyano-7-deazaguanine reductase QueF [Planctomycetaceae bacterium]|tara:strand:+ start:1958 stop:2344 length:387 start_codon:yes stop_codon:yes gene_type:complete
MIEPTGDILETFENPYPGRDYVIETVCPEFTSMCPKTGQPDFGTLTISYIAEATCYELKSLKLYLQQFRNHGAFYEAVTNRILDDLVAATSPRWMAIVGEFTPRGGISTTVTAEYDGSDSVSETTAPE